MSNIKHEEIPHDNLFGSLYKQMTERVGESQARHDIHQVFAQIMDSSDRLSPILLKFDFEDKSLSRKWLAFEKEAEGLAYLEKLKLFENTGLMETIGQMPPFYILSDHTDYWETHPDVQVPLSFDDDNGYRAKRVLEKYPVSPQYQDLVDDYVQALQAPYNDILAVALEGDYDSVAALMQADVRFEGGKAFPIYAQMESLGDKDYRIAQAGEMVANRNDLIAVFMRNKEYPEASSLSALLSYRQESGGVLQITDSVLYNDWTNPLKEALFEKIEDIAFKTNCLIVSNSWNMDGRYLEGMGSEFSRHQAKEQITRDLSRIVREYWDYPSFSESDIADTFFESLEDYAKQSFLAEAVNEWQDNRERLANHPDERKAFLDGLQQAVKDKMEQVKEVIKVFSNQTQFSQKIPFVGQETFNEMAERVMKMDKFQKAFTQIWDTVESLKTQAKADLRESPKPR